MPIDFAPGPFAVKLEVHAASGDWKRDWYFDGFGITKNLTQK